MRYCHVLVSCAIVILPTWSQVSYAYCHVALTGKVTVSSQLWPMQFSGRVTLLTWECMQNNALPGSVATQVATKVLPQAPCTFSRLWYLPVVILL